MSILVYVQNREERIESIVIPPKASEIRKTSPQYKKIEAPTPTKAGIPLAR